jgi:hypothetical protein
MTTIKAPTATIKRIAGTGWFELTTYWPSGMVTREGRPFPTVAAAKAAWYEIQNEYETAMLEQQWDRDNEARETRYWEEGNFYGGLEEMFR